MRIGYVGLGKMGKNMVLRLLEHGHEVAVFNRSPEPVREVTAAGAVGCESLEELVAKLPAPKVVWLMLPAGEVTDNHVGKLLDLLGVGDLVIDGGNSFYKDTMNRRKLYEAKGAHLVDVGVSGGPEGARNGACLLVGGDEAEVELIRPILSSLAAAGSWYHVGRSGAGHYAKMIHNGIEYGMMQAIAEGAALIKYSEFDLDVRQVFRAYGNGSVIASKLVDWTVRALETDPSLSSINSQIGASGEGEWTVNTAREKGIATPAIESALRVRKESERVDPDSPDGFRNKVVSAMRGQFGGHEVTKK